MEIRRGLVKVLKEEKKRGRDAKLVYDKTIHRRPVIQTKLMNGQLYLILTSIPYAKFSQPLRYTSVSHPWPTLKKRRCK